MKNNNKLIIKTINKLYKNMDSKKNDENFLIKLYLNIKKNLILNKI